MRELGTARRPPRPKIRTTVRGARTGSGPVTCCTGTSPPRRPTGAGSPTSPTCTAWSGVVYVAFVVDIYSRAIVGWSAATHKRAKLVLDALDMALWRRDRAGIPPDRAWCITAMPDRNTRLSRSPPT